ncbi:MAG: hypothetical protein M1834_002431 [Cirrosporium novae-zelandiae]|nr:MAG: hypothetical protein M1834_002431 [Cirrosporium novae-zelandiae]
MVASDDLPDIDDLELSDPDTDELFDSPTQTSKKAKAKAAEHAASKPQVDGPSTSKAKAVESRYETVEAREETLRKELENVRNINQVIEGVVESLERAKSNMETVSRTVNSASTLLNTWHRILSLAEHNQRLILNPSWQGVSQDITEMENESILRQQEAERKELEVQRRKEAAAARKAEEEERRKEELATSSKNTRGTRSRGRVARRGTSGTGRSYVGVGGQGGVRGSSRGVSSGYGRVTGHTRTTSTTRGRGKNI